MSPRQIIDIDPLEVITEAFRNGRTIEDHLDRFCRNLRGWEERWIRAAVEKDLKEWGRGSTWVLFYSEDEVKYEKIKKKELSSLIGAGEVIRAMPEFDYETGITTWDHGEFDRQLEEFDLKHGKKHRWWQW